MQYPPVQSRDDTRRRLDEARYHDAEREAEKKQEKDVHEAGIVADVTQPVGTRTRAKKCFSGVMKNRMFFLKPPWTDSRRPRENVFLIGAALA